MRPARSGINVPGVPATRSRDVFLNKVAEPGCIERRNLAEPEDAGYGPVQRSGHLTRFIVKGVTENRSGGAGYWTISTYLYCGEINRVSFGSKVNRNVPPGRTGTRAMVTESLFPRTQTWTAVMDGSGTVPLRVNGSPRTKFREDRV
jgi:hypothetical protein